MGGGAGDVLGGGPSLSASQKLQQRRELAAQKRRERQLSAGTVTRNPAATATVASMHQPMRPRPPSGGGMPPPSAPLGANPYSAPRPNPLFNASSGGGAGSGMQQNPLAAMNGGMNQRQQQQQQQVQPPAFDRHTMAMYAERRSFNISGDGHDNAPRVPDGQVRGFNDGSPHSIGTRGPAFEPDGVTELRRDLEAHGLADEFDPNEGRHPMEVAAERERTQRIEAAAKLGPKAKRIAERPKAARVDASDKRMFLMQPGPARRAGAVPHRATRDQRVPAGTKLPGVLPLPGRTWGQTRGSHERGQVPCYPRVNARRARAATTSSRSTRKTWLGNPATFSQSSDRTLSAPSLPSTTKGANLGRNRTVNRRVWNHGRTSAR